MLADPDVAVVGASPAGLASAYRAASLGADVQLVEAGRIGHPEPPAVVGFDHIWPDAVQPPEHVLRRRFEAVSLAAPGGREVRVIAPGRIVDRARLDTWLAEQAREAGAHIATETGPWQVTGPGRLTQEDAELDADVVVFADGARSIAGELIDPVQEPDHLVWGVTHEVPHQAELDHVPITIGDHAPGGRTQVVPLGEDRLWHWAFARRSREDAIELAEQSLQRAAERHGWPDEAVSQARRRHVAPDPVFQRPGTLAGERTLVAGGAAGLGGLETGLASGRAAGRAAARASDTGTDSPRELGAYHEACHERFAPAYRGLAQLMQVAEKAPDRLIDALAWPLADREVPLERVAGLAVDRPGSRLSALAGLLAGVPGQAAGAVAAALTPTRDPA